MSRKHLSRRNFLKGLGIAATGASFANMTTFLPKRAFGQDAPDVMYSADLALTPEEIEEIASMNLRFGFNMNHRTDDFINQVIAGGEAAAEDYGIELLVGEANFDAAKQLSDVEALVQQEVDAIFMIAVDSDSISRAIIQANDAGIPVVVVGGPPTRGEILSLMNSTSYDGCFESCKFLVDSVGGTGKIGVISIPLALSTIRDRETGTLDAIGESQMQLIGLQPVFSQDEALAAAENMIQAHPDLTAIFATWSLAVNGVLAAVEASGNDIKVSGYDAEVAGFMAFHEGNPNLLSLAGQQGRQQGITGLDALCKNILGQPVASDILVPTVLVTAEDYMEKWDELYPGVEVPWEAEMDS
ncbi:MAG: sugar ABC transporter substrate-binding protein [Chloroflexota bacterium]